ncbi:MAG: response regulator transcription factor [Cyanobacteria bacterium SZAS LIN-3]|nr:response regulator transcription factor [Cyanobacteria bacterium SZAS LIN-3]
MSKFLLIDDDIELGYRLRDWLEAKSIQLEIANTGGDGLQMLHSFQYELILLDWRLPDMTGLEVCRKFRQNGGNTHIIFLTGENSIDNKEEGLLSGGDDYIVKPFDMRELYARIKTVLRRSLDTIPEKLEIQGVVLDADSRKVYVDAVAVAVTPRECALLEYLMRHANRPYSAQRLLAAIWPSEAEVSEGTVRTCVLNLRKKLAGAGKPDLIKQVVSSGYVIENK